MSPVLEGFPATSVMLAEGSIGLKYHKLELGDGAVPLIISSLPLPSCFTLLLPFWCKYFKNKQKKKKKCCHPPYHPRNVPCERSAKLSRFSTTDTLLKKYPTLSPY